MSQERWDVVIKVLSGPMQGLGEQVLRGPVVRIGVNPGPGGLTLAGYRGLDARHAVITAYDGGSATIAPVGTNQVRLAPHSNVNWKEIDPVTSPQYLNQGGCVHLGPVGRGATLEFVKCQRLGQWTQGGLASEAAGVNANAPIKAQGNAIPASYQAKSGRVGIISATTAPLWFLGCMFLFTMTAVAVMAAVLIALYVRPVKKLGPIDDGDYFYSYAQVDREQLAEWGVLDGLDQPMAAFVMGYNADKSDRQNLRDVENWDQNFKEYVGAAFAENIQHKNVFRRLEEIKNDYADVVGKFRAADMPDVFAAIPYRESRYKPEETSIVCAKGYWQFMPEVAYRLETQEGLNFKVRDCTFKNGGTWSPADNKDLAPPPGLTTRGSLYYDPAEGSCKITKCAIDDRTDLDKSTEAAIFSLAEAWNDDDISNSGAAVQITIASHNAGYQDGRFGEKYRKSGNLKPAYNNWKKDKPEREWPNFYGANLTCQPNQTDGCRSAMPAETQHYVYSIVALHFLAVCYYGKNHSDMPDFAQYEKFVEGEDAYCNAFNIPTKQEVQ